MGRKYLKEEKIKSSFLKLAFRQHRFSCHHQQGKQGSLFFLLKMIPYSRLRQFIIYRFRLKTILSILIPVYSIQIKDSTFDRNRFIIN